MRKLQKGRYRQKFSKSRAGTRKQLPSKKRKSDMPKLIGELRLHRDGYGFVIADKVGVEDVFVPARYIGDALHTDLVEVEVKKGRGDKFEGRIVGVVERRVQKIVGRLENFGKGFRVVALDNRVRRQIKINPKGLHGARHGDEVVTIITSYPDGENPMLGEIAKVIEGRGHLDTEEEVIIINNQLPTSFPEDVEEEARRLYEKVDLDDFAGRRDLTDISFITIDGESAKDFDDAVAVKKLSSGIIRLWVSIADVSHFVFPGSKIDGEAYKRSTSVYFPQKCLPMLPEVLSNDLCSLKPDVNRFTLTAQMDIDVTGSVVGSTFYKSVIKSRRRMTYEEIKKILVEEDSVVCDAHSELLDDIRLMQDCHNRLRSKRIERGSIDFDLPEPEILIDLSGDIENIVKAERHVGHMMIEEFMIAANESVAEFLTKKGRGCVYRVHEPPLSDKLNEFSKFMHNLGFNLRFGKSVPPAKLANIVKRAKGHPEERLINHKLLRSMSQAVYSSENLGHYGLASSCYCHFTSPIRRYPDLIVHRLLAAAFTEGAVAQPRAKGKPLAVSRRRSNLADLAEHCSRRERIAMGAEREMAKLYAALFMKDKIGESFEGAVSHVAKFGVFVELLDYFVEGVIHLTGLTDDFYQFDEHGLCFRGRKTKRIIKIGDLVKVEVEDVNIADREISFELLEHKIIPH